AADHRHARVGREWPRAVRAGVSARQQHRPHRSGGPRDGAAAGADRRRGAGLSPPRRNDRIRHRRRAGAIRRQPPGRGGTWPRPQLAAPAACAHHHRESRQRMTRWLRDAPIRQKLIVLGVLASASAMLVVSVVFLVATYVGARRSVRDAVLAQAAIASDTVSAPLAFYDRAAATDTLRALRSLAII